MNFIYECKEVPFLNKIKFNFALNSKDFQDFQIILINPEIFPNLTTLEFNDNNTFTFPNNAALTSFIANKYIAYTNFISNLTSIKMSSETNDFTKIKDFCKSKLTAIRTSILEKKLIDLKTDLSNFRALTICHPYL